MVNASEISGAEELAFSAYVGGTQDQREEIENDVRGALSEFGLLNDAYTRGNYWMVRTSNQVVADLNAFLGMRSLPTFAYDSENSDPASLAVRSYT